MVDPDRFVESHADDGGVTPSVRWRATEPLAHSAGTAPPGHPVRRRAFLRSCLGVVAGVPLLRDVAAADEREARWARIAAHFEPPAEFAGQLGKFPSPLRFYDGRPVATAADWPARRAEILATWHREMGPWPELLTRPRLELGASEDIAGVVRRRVQLEVAPGVRQPGFLLTPQRAARRPAVFVPFYAPEPMVDYQGPVTGQAARYANYKRGRYLDFAWQLARRGFVTLAIGTPGDDAYRPQLSGARCQPLSYHAYIAANAHTALAQHPGVDPARIGVMGFSYGGKWALFASCFHEPYACAVWNDPGIVFDESQPPTNYWEPWYLGLDPEITRRRGPVAQDNPRTGAYRRLIERGHDLTEVHALMAPRPFLVSGGNLDGAPARWVALNHAVAVNRLLGHERRVAHTSRPDHAPNAVSNEQAYLFLEHFLGPVPDLT